MSADTRFAFKYDGTASANQATIFRTLVHDGPLLLAQEHMLSEMLPEALADHASGAKQTSMGQVHAMTIGGLYFSPEVSRGGMHFAISKDRYCRLFRDLDAAQVDMTPIFGDAETAVPIATRRITTAILSLPADQRTVEASDVMYDGDQDDPRTGTWFDYVTPAAISRGGGGMAAVATWCNLTPGCFYHGAAVAGGRDGDDFKQLIDSFAASVGKDITDMPPQSQAAEVVGWFSRTRPPRGFVLWTEPNGGVEAELQRRSRSSESERYVPLFEMQWRQVYGELHALWPQALEEPAEAAATLATSLDITVPAGGIVPQTIGATCGALVDLLPFATEDDNTARTAQVVKAHMARKLRGANEELSHDDKIP